MGTTNKIKHHPKTQHVDVSKYHRAYPIVKALKWRDSILVSASSEVDGTDFFYTVI